MEEKKKETLKLLPSNPEEQIEPANEEPPKESFLRRALNRTKEAFKSVDEAITGREASKKIEERFLQQTELNEIFITKIDESFAEAEKLRSRLDEEINSLVTASAEQKATFERTFAEINSHAEELRKTAEESKQALEAASNQQIEMHKQASGQLARWQNDSEGLKNDVRNLQLQLTQLQQSFKQFVITALAGMFLIVILITYLLFRH